MLGNTDTRFVPLVRTSWVFQGGRQQNTASSRQVLISHPSLTQHALRHAASTAARSAAQRHSNNNKISDGARWEAQGRERTVYDRRPALGPGEAGTLSPGSQGISPEEGGGRRGKRRRRRGWRGAAAKASELLGCVGWGTERCDCEGEGEGERGGKKFVVSFFFLFPFFSR